MTKDLPPNEDYNSTQEYLIAQIEKKNKKAKIKEMKRLLKQLAKQKKLK